MLNIPLSSKFICVSVAKQQLQCFEKDEVIKSYTISTARNGVGEKKDSECTPRGWHVICARIGLGLPLNAVLVGRQWTKEIYTEELATKCPNRDWILTRILRLDGIELGRNKNGKVDSFNRYIYIHGTKDSTLLGVPNSHGCIRMYNKDVVNLTNWSQEGMLVYIE